MHKHVAQALRWGPIPRQNGVATHSRRHPGHHAFDLLVTEVAGANVHDVFGVTHGPGMIPNICS
jgi:hypothetical protein